MCVSVCVCMCACACIKRNKDRSPGTKSSVSWLLITAARNFHSTWSIRLTPGPHAACLSWKLGIGEGSSQPLLPPPCVDSPTEVPSPGWLHLNLKEFKKYRPLQDTGARAWGSAFHKAPQLQLEKQPYLGGRCLGQADVGSDRGPWTSTWCGATSAPRQCAVGTEPGGKGTGADTRSHTQPLLHKPWCHLT